MILGISCGPSSTRCEPGAGISLREMASDSPSSKRRPIKVLKEFTRSLMIIKLMTRKMAVPLAHYELEISILFVVHLSQVYKTITYVEHNLVVVSI
jgi:hypothetical protein